MIVLHKKRLIWILGMLCFSMSFFMLTGLMKQPETVQTVNLPVTNKVIVLDAGHRYPR